MTKFFKGQGSISIPQGRKQSRYQLNYPRDEVMKTEITKTEKTQQF